MWILDQIVHSISWTQVNKSKQNRLKILNSCLRTLIKYANFTKQILISLSGILSLSSRINGIFSLLFCFASYFFILVRLLFILFLVVLCATSIFSYNLCVFLFGIALCTVENLSWFSLTLQKTFFGTSFIIPVSN